MKPLICIVGPTACGKTKMGVLLAGRYDGEVVSCDSMQLYRGMVVGTAAPTPEETGSVPHHMVGVVDPAESYSVARYAEEAGACVDGILARGKQPIIVGGTGLYFSALLRGLDRRWEKPPPEYPVIRIDRAVVRARIAARLDAMFMAGLDAEKRRLKELYPAWSRTASLAIGYREGDDRAKILTRTCQLAKRQDTWFRHQATPIYVDPSAEAVRECWRSRGPWKVSFPT